VITHHRQHAFVAAAACVTDEQCLVLPRQIAWCKNVEIRVRALSVEAHCHSLPRPGAREKVHRGVALDRTDNRGSSLSMRELNMLDLSVILYRHVCAGQKTFEEKYNSDECGMLDG